MKPEIHPQYFPQAQVICACGNTWTTGSTQEVIRTDVCSQCHPFFTGEQRIVDTEGQVDRFYKKLQARQQYIEEVEAREAARTSVDRPIVELELSTRATDALAKAEIVSVGQALEKDYDLIILDTAPGAHCDIIHALEDSNIVVSVTEPTPYGMHDLKRILELITYLPTKPTSKIVLNRSDMTKEKPTFAEVEQEYQASLIGEIPLSRELQLSYAEGLPIMEKFMTDILYPFPQFCQANSTP